MGLIRDENYYQISGWMLNQLELKGTQLQVFAIIYGFTQDGENKFEGSINYLCEFTGASRWTVLRALNELTANELLEKEEIYRNGVKFCNYRVNLQQVVAKCYRGSSKMLQGSSKMLQGGSSKMLHHNIDIHNNKYNNSDNNRESVSDKIIKVKHKYGEYKNVLLTDDELAKLQAEYPDWEQKIENLSAYIASKGAKYKSHYATIRNWARKDKEKQTQQSKPVNKKAAELDEFYKMAQQWAGGEE